MPDGSPLPVWLTFEPGINRFTGTPPQGQANLTVVLIGHDSSGGEAFTAIQLNFNQESQSQ